MRRSREERREEAEARQESYDKLSIKERIEKAKAASGNAEKVLKTLRRILTKGSK